LQKTRFSQLSKPRQALIRLCQRVNYGSILNVRVAEGEVRFDTPPEVLFDVKLDGEFTPRRELDLADFGLPVESRRLLEQIDFLTNGVVEKITVHDGIPRRAVLRGPFLGVCK
jgi:hypothetical protein